MPKFDATRDPERFAMLRRTRLVGALTEPVFDRLTRLAMRLVNAPIALVTRIDGDRQFFLSCVGLPEPRSATRRTSLSFSLCKHVVATGDPLVVPDLAADQVLGADTMLRQFGVASYAAIPLRTTKGRVLGTFCVLDRVPREWTGEQLEVLTTLAYSATSEIELRSALGRQAQLAVEIASGRNEARAAALAQQEHGALLSAVIDSQQEIAQAGFSLDTVLQRVAALSARLTGAEGAAILMLRDSELEYIAVTPGTEHLVGTRVPADGSLAGLAMRSGTTLVCHDTESDPRVVREVARRIGVRSSISAPLDVQGEALGAVMVGSRMPNAFTEAHGKVLQLLAGFVGVAIRRAEEYGAKQALVAERTAALERLRESEERLRALVDASPLAIIVADFDDVIHVWNAAAERMFGWSAAEVLGQRGPHVPDDAKAEVQVILETTQKGNAITGLVTQRVRRNGARIDVDQSTAPLRDASGRPSFVMSVVADITEQRQLEQQLRQSQKMEAVGRLAGGVAHDFNNLLTVIRANADFILEDLAADDAHRGEVDEISKAADRAAALTRQLLVFSRRQVVQPKTVQLNEIVVGMKLMLARLIGEGIVLASVLEPELGAVHADVGQLEQVLLNLVVNARDAMPLGGAIVVATCNALLGPEALGWHMPVQPGEYVQLTVSDTGAGMTPDVKMHIFEPFFTTKEPGKGTGLGLSTVYGIVQQMNGSVVVRSEPGDGTIFTIYLPIVTVGAPVAPPVDSRVELRMGTETILLVEDEDAVRRLARRALEMSGYRILEASHGGEALRVCEDHCGEIDLLLTDVVMPHMSGAELAERLKPLRPQMRVLFMSGYTEDALGNHGVLAPETALLYKPFTPDSLRRTVREQLDSVDLASNDTLGAVRPASNDTAAIDVTEGD